jgi:uncharacterized glyoxalase superfamily protein PhnB
MPDMSKRPACVSALSYKDPMAAFEWLQKAFGFEPAMLITDGDGNLAHSEMTHGDGWIMVGSEWTDDHRSPANLGGKNTQTVHVQVTTDIDAHFANARAHGAEIMVEPETQFYGDRTYRARDPEGHYWTFGQTVETIAPEAWDKNTGLKTTLWP